MLRTLCRGLQGRLVPTATRGVKTSIGCACRSFDDRWFLVHPFTFLACTYNLWSTFRWEERRRPLERFLELHRPDILCAQELSPGAATLIGDTMSAMNRVDDPFSGWLNEGNIFWNTDLFELVDYGAVDIGMLEENRRLFHVRLQTTTGVTVVIATAHFSWSGNVREITEDVNIRIGQAERAAVALDSLVGPDEPVLFMGDFNGYIHPLRKLRNAGFDDSFMSVGRQPSMTFPAFPIARQPPELLDWMMHRGPIRPTLTSVIDFHVAGFPPSDHKPILTTYQLQ
ncbi:MAG: endonuclease/exonuclease/phosphatase family protein [Acidobacteria bacterium]|nr:endonuclease/exonuclease/phosphatase family protein [Acidobacteriota bacterium]